MNGNENTPAERAQVRAYDAIRALAFVGDLSMGQPTDHSLRTAWLAAQLALAAGEGDALAATSAQAALLRWSGCTANAAGFADMLGDDVAGREAMLAQRQGWAQPLERQGMEGEIKGAIRPLAQIHCEVSGEVARILHLTTETEAALRHIFEAWDGSGMPDGLAGAAVPRAVYVVSLAGDLDILSRVYGLPQALSLIAAQAGTRYPADLAALVARHAAHWLEGLATREPAGLDESIQTPQMLATTSTELIADVIDLKLPWMTGYSRAVARAAAACSARLGADEASEARVYAAALIHGIGRAAVPNVIWNSPGRLSAAEWEKVRLVPYWTARAGKQTGSLAQAAELASYAYERLDGSGYFRGAGGQALSPEARMLSAAVAFVALGEKRPWRDALTPGEVTQRLRSEANEGRFDAEVVEALIDARDAPPRATHATQATRTRQQTLRLSARETDVLRAISRGASNKEAARALDLSPSTVRTHVESVFRKLECSTRAAATLKASALGLL
ncbi:HD domain-containing phosphohydrolase [Paraburkholderia pallida]|uniref:LuxR family transcriptional regulator n=1 Tax=Paraburkholderia pallida TaxID=2547399 RepID=A0A4V1AZ05_9BURK|nr:HD domain-containing phosphohydrolase [Paraburkholderia pallida]QBQ97592.1 LuxR family transcriptional regulator [Paraburkholderia pallida]